MANARGSCPSCGAPVEFKIGDTPALVCPHCRHVVVRGDRGFASLGRVADVVFSDVGLVPGDRGRFGGRPFEVAGRLVLQHPAGGTWEEYFAIFEGHVPAWISEAQGRWTVVGRANVAAPPLGQIAPSQPVWLGNATYVVAEIGQGTFLAAEGELPFAASPGTLRAFADLSGPGGAWATIDYGDGRAAPQVYLGVETVLAQLGLEPRRMAQPPPQAAKVNEIQCPSCGAPLPLFAPGKTEHVACRYCGSISAVGTRQVLQRQEAARRDLWLPLGSKGALAGGTWVVIGYMRRSTSIEGETFSWDEYLLYDEARGYCWLVIDEGVLRIATALGAADVDVSHLPRMVIVGGERFALRNAGIGRVDLVLGEFYWKVRVGETVDMADYEHGPRLVSAERTAGEVNWTFSKPLSVGAIRDAFGVTETTAAIVADRAATDRRRGASVSSMVLVLFVLVFVLSVYSCGQETIGGRYFGGSGGFGGK